MIRTCGTCTEFCEAFSLLIECIIISFRRLRLFVNGPEMEMGPAKIPLKSIMYAIDSSGVNIYRTIILTVYVSATGLFQNNEFTLLQSHFLFFYLSHCQ